MRRPTCVFDPHGARDAPARGRVAPVVAACLALLLAPGAVLANWAEQGVPVCVSPPAMPSSGYTIAVVSDGTGGCFVVWQDQRTTQNQIYAQRLDPSGAPVWTLNGVRVAPTSADQEEPKVVMTPDGGILVVWCDRRIGNGDIYAQRLTGAGAVASGWPVAGAAVTAGNYFETVLSALPDGGGGAIVAWFRYIDAADWDVRVSRITGSGTLAAGWPADGVRLGALGFYQGDATLASDGSGGAYVVWAEGLSGSEAVRACRLTGNGAVVAGWSALGLALSNWGGPQTVPQIAASTDHTAIVLWQDARNGEADIFAQHVAGDGTMLWGASGLVVCAADGSQTDPQMCPDGAGGVVATWADERDGALPMAVYAQRLDANGVAQWTINGRKVSPEGVHAIYPMIGPDGAGGATIAWIDQRTGLDIWEIYAQHVVWDGRKAWPAVGRPVCTEAGNQWGMLLARDAADGAIIVWRDDRATSPGIYAWQGDGRSDLTCAVTGFGWTSPAVPRNATAPGPYDVTPTPTLDGNAGNTYLNWLFGLEGPNPVPASITQCWIDDATGWQVAFGDSSPPQWWAAINVGPNTVRGGRHTLTSLIDPADLVPESDESDNVWSGQWVWSPLPLARNVPVQRGRPPVTGDMPIPNMDGMQFTRPDLSLAWVVSIAERASLDDYDLYVYDDYSGSTAGFSHPIGGSSLTGNFTDYVVGHYSGTPATVYPAAVLYDPGGGGYNYFADATDALGRNAVVTPQAWSQVELAPGRLADVYEMYLYAGHSYGWTLLRLAGESYLEVRVFSPAPGGVHARYSSLAEGVFLAPGIAQLAYTAVEEGWHPVVVARTSGDYAIYPAQYTLRWNAGAPVDVPGGAPVAWELTLAGAAPNPAREYAALQYTVPERTAVRLELFDLEGRRVRTLVNESVEAGPHAATWDCRDAAGARVGPGLYWARLTAQGRTIAKRVTVMW